MLWCRRPDWLTRCRSDRRHFAQQQEQAPTQRPFLPASPLSSLANLPLVTVRRNVERRCPTSRRSPVLWDPAPKPHFAPGISSPSSLQPQTFSFGRNLSLSPGTYSFNLVLPSVGPLGRPIVLNPVLVVFLTHCVTLQRFGSADDVFRNPDQRSRWRRKQRRIGRSPTGPL